MKTIKITKLIPNGVDLDQDFKVDYKFLNNRFYLDETDLRFNGLTLFDFICEHGESAEMSFLFYLSESLRLATLTIQAVCDVCDDESDSMGDCLYCYEMRKENEAIKATEASLFISER